MMNLTKKESESLFELICYCLRQMGGNHPKDLNDDPYTWVDPENLLGKTAWNFTKHQVAGMWSALENKGLLCIDEEGDHLTQEAINEAIERW